MDLSRVQAVLLDMDGTLVDSDAAVERSWLSWAREYPVDPGRGPLVAPGLPAVGNVRRLRPDLSEDEAAAAAQHQLELEYDDVSDVTAAPGARELLAELDRLGLPCTS
jgi:beta-phosphoglucomutase-like phosphatase (HAD superfamily)